MIFLTGELGAGKTTLTQSIAKELGVQSSVSSPTFVMINEYQLADQNILAHIDLYRTGKIDDVKSIGLDELLGSKDVISIVEWPEKQPVIESFGHIHLTLSRIGQKRQVLIENHGEDEESLRLFETITRACHSVLDTESI